MRLDDVALAQRFNAALNAPTVADLVAEDEALVYEIERRMLQTAADHKALMGARDKARAVVRAHRRSQR